MSVPRSVTPRLLEGGRTVGAGALPLDFTLFRDLVSGPERALLRQVTWMRHHRMNRISVAEALQRLGSTQRNLAPSRIERALGSAHQRLMHAGVILDVRLVGSGAGKALEYAFPQPTRLDDATLLAQTLAYGVHQPIAAELVRGHRDNLLAVLAAVTNGTLVPRTNLPGMIAHYAQRGLVTPTQHLSSPRPMPAEGAAEDHRRYLGRMAMLRAWKIQEGGEAAALAERLRREVRRDYPGHPSWFTEGLLALLLTREFKLPPYKPSHT